MHNILIDGSKEAKNIFIFAHGAGSNMDSDFMNSVVKYLISNNIMTVRFEFPYMQKKRNGIKSFPDRIEKLSEYFIYVIQYVKKIFLNKNIWIGGKSLGGRVACIVSKKIEIDGVIVFGYPFHSLKKPKNIRDEILRKNGPPILILQGDRDKMGNKNEVNSYNLQNKIKILFLEGGDHSFLTLKKSKFSQNDLIKKACVEANNFINKN